MKRGAAALVISALLALWQPTATEGRAFLAEAVANKRGASGNATGNAAGNATGNATGNASDNASAEDRQALELFTALQGLQANASGLATRVRSVRGQLRRLSRTVAALSLNLTRAEQRGAAVGLTTAATQKRLPWLESEDGFLNGQLGALKQNVLVAVRTAENATAAAARINSSSTLVDQLKNISDTISSFSPGGKASNRIVAGERALTAFKAKVYSAANQTVTALLPGLLREQKTALENLTNVSMGEATLNWTNKEMAYYRFPRAAAPAEPSSAQPLPHLRRRPCAWTQLFDC
eukprot:TRINITY_DN5029_c0_g3_i1.p1 TRINITY_DN5029_c0_g3~~TRINITY_DN5029_c0_g3_i1.p1  ORF type:complete len:294 (+),score=83.97 TRINITY_DN5029_c0_g3_i1:76-957(+)